MDEVRVLGRLMTDYEYKKLNPGVPDYFSNVFGGNKVKIKPISELPENISKVNEFTCIVDFLDDNLKYCNEYEIKQRLECKLIVFTPKENEKGYLCYSPEYVDFNNNELLEIDNFVAVPVVDLDALGLKLSELDNKLCNKNVILIHPKISYAHNDAPRFFLVKEKKLLGYGYNFYLYSGFERILLREEGVIFDFNDKILNIKFDVEVDGNMIIDDSKDDIVYIPFSLERKYIRKLNLPSDDQVEQKLNNINEMNNKNLENMKCNFSIDNFISYAERKSLIYDRNDLINFDISINTSSLVILSGMSGTGKSQLVRTYAEALGIDKYNGFKFISVSPAWCDDSDILGYVDYKNMLYREADCGLVKFLIEAAKSTNPKNKYLVCFDEMNLAKVEHYFSQFLSILENDSEDRFLTVYNENLESRLYNSNIYPPKIKIGRNVAFVGTVNVDESTFNFSDKVLDRASVIELSMQPFARMKEYFAKCNLNEREFKLFDELQMLFMNENPKFGIGYRVVKQINDYLGYVNENDIYSRSEAIDRLLVQRILPKLRGTGEQVSNIIGYIDNDGSLVESKLEKILDEFNDISSFEIMKVKIKSKAKELKSYGYTI